MDRRRQMRTRVRHDREVGKSESRSGEGGGEDERNLERRRRMLIWGRQSREKSSFSV